MNWETVSQLPQILRLTERVTADRKDLRQVSEAQLETQVEQHHLENDVGRHLQEVEFCPGPFIECRHESCISVVASPSIVRKFTQTAKNCL